VNVTVKKPRALIIILIALAVILAFFGVWFFAGRGADKNKAPESPSFPGNGLFSWHDEVLEEDEREILFELMKNQGLTELYQDVPLDAPAAQIRDFAKACEENGIRFYLLIGEPEWALDKNGTNIRAQIQRAALIGCAGVMVDVEPGSTDEWKSDRKPVMTSMTKSFLKGKAAAEENGIEMIVCLSYYYDDYGFEEEIETIVEKGCDALAIMNYNREDEAGQIVSEAALCKKYGKRLINIYELQEVGKYYLEEIHTYREAGLSALQKSRAELIEAFEGQQITFALHEYRALKEMTGS
jgi:hypothetical protein